MKTMEMNSPKIAPAAVTKPKQSRDPALERRPVQNPWRPETPNMTREEIRQIVLDVLG
jgi:hypothetical protein